MTPSTGSRADQIIERVRAIPEGFVRTYGDIDPDAPRLVGRVLATHCAGDDPGGNAIPWHRVVRADGRVPRGAAQIERLRQEGVPISEMLASHLPTSNVVKAFNTIIAAQIVEHATAAGTPHRRALPIAGDETAAKRVVTGLIDAIGFDVVDAGPLAEGRRLDPMTAWGPVLDAQELRRSLGLG